MRTHLCGGEFKTVAASSMMLKAKEKSFKRTEDADDAEVRELRRQVQQLQEQLAVMSVSHTRQSSWFLNSNINPFLHRLVSSRRKIKRITSATVVAKTAI